MSPPFRYPSSSPVQCPRCSAGLLEHITTVPSFGTDPKFLIYQCFSCHFVEWLQDKMKE